MKTLLLCSLFAGLWHPVSAECLPKKVGMVLRKSIWEMLHIHPASFMLSQDVKSFFVVWEVFSS